MQQLIDYVPILVFAKLFPQFKKFYTTYFVCLLKQKIIHLSEKRGFCAGLSVLEKCFKICHMLCTRKPMYFLSIFHFVQHWVLLYGCIHRIWQRIKELKKMRQRLAYSSFAWKSSWILITSLDLLKRFFRALSWAQTSYF